MRKKHLNRPNKKVTSQSRKTEGWPRSAHTVDRADLRELTGKRGALKVGEKGELLAGHFLRRRGYTILERGFRLKVGEIDLVAAKNGTVVFCEVKTRLNRKFGEPFEAVTALKQMRIKSVASAYLATRGGPGQSYRFDVISILLQDDGAVAEFVHLKNAFC